MTAYDARTVEAAAKVVEDFASAWETSPLVLEARAAGTGARSIAAAIRALPVSPGTTTGEGACRRCGGPNVCWHAPSPLWNAVMRGGSIDGPWEYSELICACCFMALAEERGIASVWKLEAQTVHVPLETVTPSGRVWDAEQGLWVESVPLPSDALGETVEKLREALEDIAEWYHPDGMGTANQLAEIATDALHALPSKED